ncbi:MAG TPA: cupin domain-containing protein [Solirubrobacteraceae bacterium]|nr:cupin domain-containing protein [Solirubrobacteraceae bacterium]
MNLFEPVWDAEVDAGEGAMLRAVRVGEHAGSRQLAATLYELDSGAVVSPLHFHHANEELLFVLSGSPTLRTGCEEDSTLSSGAVVSFPAGPRGTHQILNRSGSPARVLICSTSLLPEVAEQPDTGLLAVITPDGLRLLPNGPTLANSWADVAW